jgi:hypothetical protein
MDRSNVLRLLLAVGCLVVPVRSYGQNAPTLKETLDWLRSRMTPEYTRVPVSSLGGTVTAEWTSTAECQLRIRKKYEKTGGYADASLPLGEIGTAESVRRGDGFDEDGVLIRIRDGRSVVALVSHVPGADDLTYATSGVLLPVADQELSARVARAIVHAARLCAAKEPF